MAPGRRRRLQRTPRRRPRPSALRSGILLPGRQSSQHHKALHASADSTGNKSKCERSERPAGSASPCLSLGTGQHRRPPSEPGEGNTVLRKQSAPSQPRSQRPEFQPCFRQVPTAWARAAPRPLRTCWAPGRGQAGKHHSQQRLPRPVIGVKERLQGFGEGEAGQDRRAGRSQSISVDQRGRGQCVARDAPPVRAQHTARCGRGSGSHPGGPVRGSGPSSSQLAPPGRPWQAMRRVHYVLLVTGAKT